MKIILKYFLYHHRNVIHSPKTIILDVTIHYTYLSAFEHVNEYFRVQS